MRRPEGQVHLERLLDAVNSLEPPVRRVVLAALREHDPNTRYFTVHDGRVEAERV
jgi:hypothetical protein